MYKSFSHLNVFLVFTRFSSNFFRRQNCQKSNLKFYIACFYLNWNKSISKNLCICFKYFYHKKLTFQKYFFLIICAKLKIFLSIWIQFISLIYSLCSCYSLIAWAIRKKKLKVLFLTLFHMTPFKVLSYVNFP